MLPRPRPQPSLRLLAHTASDLLLSSPFQIQTFKDIILQKEEQLTQVNQLHEQELFKLAAKSDASADLEQVTPACSACNLSRDHSKNQKSKHQTHL